MGTRPGILTLHPEACLPCGRACPWGCSYPCSPASCYPCSTIYIIMQAISTVIYKVFRGCRLYDPCLWNPAPVPSCGQRFAFWELSEQDNKPSSVVLRFVLSAWNWIVLCNVSIEGGARAGPIAPSEKAFPYLRLKLFGEANSPTCHAVMTHRSTLHSNSGNPI